MLERIKAGIANVEKDIETEQSKTYAAEISAEVAEAETAIRNKYAKIKAEKVEKLTNIKDGLEYLLDVEAEAAAEAQVSAEEKNVAAT